MSDLVTLSSVLLSDDGHERADEVVLSRSPEVTFDTGPLFTLPADDLNEAAFALPLNGYYLVRHATTKMNEVGRVRGWDDPKVSKLGKKQAKQVGKWFVGKNLAGIESSDLRRAVYSAAKISKATGAPITEINRVLRAWDLGEFQGRLTSDIDPLVEDYARNRPFIPIPGGESFHAFRTRTLSCAQRVMQSYERGEGGGPIAQVTHSRNIRLVAAWIKAGRPESFDVDLDLFFSLAIPDAGILRLTLADLGQWSYRVIAPVKDTPAQ